ncbi:hypothetical protein [Streptomyces sp. TRM49041]|uniref:hypothetical protein n=1 Tax=Streptomyces sp. TRM49041 TaxID=2603216 RepID=UPI0011EEEA15|nr:hypothetical protein [Streptomyces sp. TRM49041]
MTEHQPAEAKAAFTHWLRELTALLDQGGGWYGVFLQRDPDGIRACLDGAEIPPWDVVESLLHDFAAARGDDTAREQTVRARSLHAAAATAHDHRPGGRSALDARLDLMLREQAGAAGRSRELVGLLAATAEGSADAEHLAHELAWLRDDHARATARIAELRARLAALPPVPPPGGPQHAFAPERGGAAAAPAQATPEEGASTPWPGPAAPSGTPHAPGWDRGPGAPAPATHGGPASAFTPEAAPGSAAPAAGDRPWPAGGSGDANTEAAPGQVPGAAADAPGTEGEAAPGRRRGRAGGKKRPRGARYAWLDDADDEPDVQEGAPGAEAVPPGLDGLSAPAATPRGARFGGGAEQTEAAPEAPAAWAAGVEDPAVVRDAVTGLLALRAQGRGGEAHALLCEAALWPAPRLPLLAAELHRAGLAADWATLLWEAAYLPSDRLAELAGALARTGRDQDARQLLRQGVARPTGETVAAVLALDDDGRGAEAHALVAAFVEARSPEDVARFAAQAPHRLVPEVLAAARSVAPASEPALVHALRVAGLVAT